jgi:hypothetical protein
MSAPQAERRLVAVVEPARLASLVREVNRRIAARSTLGAVAFACECERRDCAAAFEAPLSVFRTVDARPGLFLVAAKHEEQVAERIVRRDGDYLVVERA